MSDISSLVSDTPKPVRKKATNGKQKGNSFERTIATTLSERFAAITGKEKAFRRNPDSGSFFGGSNQSRTKDYDTESAQYGDLITPKNFKWAIECKFYKTAPSLNSVIQGKNEKWNAWLSQSNQDAKNSGKLAMLVVKYNQVDIMAFVDEVDSAPFGTPIMTFQHEGTTKFIYPFTRILETNDTAFFD